ncbi:hypothetical protein GCM10017714_10870 [Curtobacterium pusillum]|uniref:Transposase n=1 Tax=Curtobacterium pusillum TaxID=69373 RepID=A0ABX2MAR7_9MICO|nr:hypothetical protein [Curtobacterium pusillum]NUU12862.1 hypothetical protein [Curtobacterium pusillum]GLK30347.1 hypothetical protein GCM10017610_06320 [Curtobacterium pusillum]
MFTIVNATVDAVCDQFAWRESPSNGPVKRSNGSEDRAKIDTLGRQATRSVKRTPFCSNSVGKLRPSSFLNEATNLAGRLP